MVSSSFIKPYLSCSLYLFLFLLHLFYTKPICTDFRSHFQKMAFPIYFSCHLVYDNPEQSREPRVKCRRNGECPVDEGIFHDGVSASAVAYGKTSFM